MRYLSTAWAEHCDLVAIFVAIPTLTARELIGFKAIVEEITKKYDDEWTIEKYDNTPLLIYSWPREHEEKYEDLDDELSCNSIIPCPDFLDMEGVRDTSYISSSIKIYKDGVFWCIQQEYSDQLIHTSTFEWDLISDLSTQKEPKNNSGRKHCWWCGTSVKDVVLFNIKSQACPHCNK